VRWEEEEGMETTLLKKKKKSLIQDSEANEENRYPVHDPNKTMINDTKELSDAHKSTLKEEMVQEATENFMEKVYMVNKMYKMHSRNFKTLKIKNMRRHRNK
jgi:hypothetical protein